MISHHGPDSVGTLQAQRLELAVEGDDLSLLRMITAVDHNRRAADPAGARRSEVGDDIASLLWSAEASKRFQMEPA